jgi:hypothetical protein
MRYLMPNSKSVLFFVMFAMLTFFSQRESYADIRMTVKSHSGRALFLLAEGNSRNVPKQNIVVCSDGTQDDLAHLTRVAREHFAAEGYKIWDGTNLPNNFELEDSTVVFFGRGTEEQIKSPCVSQVQGFAEYIALRVKLTQRLRLGVLNNLAIKGNSEAEHRSLGYCSPQRPITTINGWNYQWSAQLRYSQTPVTNGYCLRSYWSVFGVTKLCTTVQCHDSEEEDFLSEFNRQ